MCIIFNVADVCNAWTMESWLSGLRRTTGNRVYVNSVPRVQIPNSPPQRRLSINSLSTGGVFLAGKQPNRLPEEKKHYRYRGVHAKDHADKSLTDSFYIIAQAFFHVTAGQPLPLPNHTCSINPMQPSRFFTQYQPSVDRPITVQESSSVS